MGWDGGGGGGGGGGETTIGMHRYAPTQYCSEDTEEDGGRRGAVGASRKIYSPVVFVPHGDSLGSGRNSGRPALGSACNVSRFHTNRGLCLLCVIFAGHALATLLQNSIKPDQGEHLNMSIPCSFKQGKSPSVHGKERAHWLIASNHSLGLSSLEFYHSTKSDDTVLEMRRATNQVTSFSITRPSGSTI